MVTITATGIDGTTFVEVNGAAPNLTFRYSIDALCDVTFTAGWAAGGSMEVHGDWEVVASGQTAAYDI